MLYGGNMSAGAGKGKYAKDFGVTRPDGSPSYGLATDPHDPTLAKQFADSHGFTLLSHQSWTRGGITQLLSTGRRELRGPKRLRPRSQGTPGRRMLHAGRLASISLYLSQGKRL